MMEERFVLSIDALHSFVVAMIWFLHYLRKTDNSGTDSLK
jgi:hypothetical protein